MKKSIAFAVLVMCFYGLNAKNLSATFSYCTFDVPGKLPYVETYLNVVGNSVKLIPAENNQLKGQIEVQWIIRSGESIIHFDKYNLLSPGIASTDSLIPDFIDLQRLNLAKGEYKIELSIRDKNSDEKATTVNQDFVIGFANDTVSISDIELIESYTKSTKENKFTKSGYDIIPFTTGFYPKEINNVRFYAEIYRTDISPADDYLVRYYLTNNESNKLLDNYVVSLKQNPKSTNVIIGDFVIKDLLSGNFNLNIEVRNKQNKLIAFKKTFFQRSNQAFKPLVTADISAIDITNTFVVSITNPDTLKEYIACLYPISTGFEVQSGENQIYLGDVRSMQQYMYYFWNNRNPDNPEKAWEDYRVEVLKVNAEYYTRNKKGYETDRGRVYLQYGPPNHIADGTEEPAAYPYEIWQYYKLKNQTNRKFVFYSNDRSSNDYRLLHSDATGEIYMASWHAFLFNRTQQYGLDFDQEKGIEPYGGHADEKFQNPH